MSVDEKRVVGTPHFPKTNASRVLLYFPLKAQYRIKLEAALTVTKKLNIFPKTRNSLSESELSGGL